MPKTHSLNNWTFSRAAWLFCGVLLLVLILDQSVKIYVKTQFSIGDIQPLFGNWLLMEYIENQGMAFGTTFGSSIWSKLALSIFRIIAVAAITIYWFKQAKKGAPFLFHLAVALILAGALGNLIDSMFYDFVFPYDPCMYYNQLEGSGNFVECPDDGQTEVKYRGFLFGNVVDMFKFEAFWPEWMPFVGGKEVFPAIWNLADGSITLGVVIVFIKSRLFFQNEKDTASKAEMEVEETSGE